MLKTIGFIIGIIAIAEGFLIYASTSRRKMLLFKLIEDVLWLFNYLFSGGYAGAILNGVAILREIVFYNRDRSRFCASGLFLPVFILLTLVSPVASMASGSEDLHALLPAVGSVLAVIGFYQSSPTVARRLGLPAQTLWLLYSVYGHNATAAAANAILLLSAVVGEVRAARTARKPCAGGGGIADNVTGEAPASQENTDKEHIA